MVWVFWFSPFAHLSCEQKHFSGKYWSLSWQASWRVSIPTLVAISVVSLVPYGARWWQAPCHQEGLVEAFPLRSPLMYICLGGSRGCWLIFNRKSHLSSFRMCHQRWMALASCPRWASCGELHGTPGSLWTSTEPKVQTDTVGMWTHAAWGCVHKTNKLSPNKLQQRPHSINPRVALTQKEKKRKKPSPRRVQHTHVCGALARTAGTLVCLFIERLFLNGHPPADWLQPTLFPHPGPAPQHPSNLLIQLFSFSI